MLDLARHFSAASSGPSRERIHLAAHSHHYWPDVTFAAQQRCWEDAALHADEKWGPIFGEVIPPCRPASPRILNLPDPVDHRGRAEHARIPAPPPLGPAGGPPEPRS